MGVPTRGEVFARLIERLRYAQEDCAMMAHLIQAEDTGSPMDRLLARGWLGVEEMLKMTVHNVTKMAMGKLQ